MESRSAAIGVSFTMVQQKGNPACLRAGVRPIGVSFTGVRANRSESYMFESRSAANRGEFYSGCGPIGVSFTEVRANRGEFYRGAGQ